ncbi:MAG: carbon-nitrogen hydrolase family protein [Candidatus Zipacnadales bacterium]
MARHIRVSTIAYQPVEVGENRLARTHEKLADLLEEAARARPDLVVLPEFCNVLGLSMKDAIAAAEPIPGPTSDMVAEIAAKHRMYVVLPIPELEGDCRYNSCALIDRQGQIVGKYHKFQPTIGEIEAGIIPGSEVPVFQTDFGRVGCAICFDLKFIEVGQQLAAKRAQLVVFASMFIGGQRLQHWARDFGCYLVSACPARSYIVDMTGRYLAETGHEINQVAAGLVPPIATATINMDRGFFHLDGNQDRFPEILRKYGPGVEILIDYPEAHFTLASNMDDITVEDLIAEFGLEPWLDYLDRARTVRRVALSCHGEERPT